jgi:hypothetical protein
VGVVGLSGRGTRQCNVGAGTGEGGGLYKRSRGGGQRQATAARQLRDIM